MPSSWFLIAAIIAFGSGVFLSSFFGSSAGFGILFLSVALFFLLFFLLRKNFIFLILAIVVFFSGLGIFRYQLSDKINISPELKDNLEQNIVLEGIVIKEPEEKENYGRFVFLAQKFIAQGAIKDLKKDKILVIAHLYPKFSYGDRLQIEGRLKKPENYSDFDWKTYLAKDNIFLEIFYPKIVFLNSGEGNFVKRILLALKDKFLSALNKILLEPHASLMAGILLGAKEGMPKELLEDFRRTGVIHIVVLSGYNIMIVADSLAKILNFFLSKRLSFSLGIIVIFLFTILSGAEPPALRAGIMASLLYYSRLQGRVYTAIISLLAAGFLMVAYNPKILLFDVSFQLSFLATAGLIFLSPRFDSLFAFLTNRWRFKEYLSSTISAQLAVFPLLLSALGKVSLIATPVNLLILPVIPLIMFFGFFSGILGFIHQWLAIIPAGIAYLLLSYQLEIVSLFSKLPFGELSFEKFPIYLSLLFYLLICGFIFFKKAA